MNQLLLATRNPDKAREFKALLSNLGVQILTLEAFPHVKEVDEDEATLAGNALKKAREVFRQVHLPTLADDSGLEVHYLNKQPGVYSSRYAGPSATYEDNCKKLLENLRGVPPRRRAARFRCVLAFVAPPASEKIAEGILPGVITERAAGNRGFGYDPVFLPEGYLQTLGEMEPSLKNTLSHRAKAIQNMHQSLAGYFNDSGRR
jgi:XTP/dITP diphosphohydrolase